MTRIATLYQAFFVRIEMTLAPYLPTFARLIFAGVLLQYFWYSARTKLGEGWLGFLSPSNGAYIQIFPKAAEAVGYDSTQLSILHSVVVIAGTWAEFALPLLIGLGVLTRLAALGMAGFIVVQSFVDVTGHGVGGDDLGTWFDAAPGALIFDQRALWLLLLAILVLRGSGPLAFDRFVRIRRREA